MKKSMIIPGGMVMAIGILIIPAAAHAGSRSNSAVSIGHGWHFSIDVGLGWNEFRATGPEHEWRYRKLGGNLDLRVGYTFSNHFTLGLLFNGGSSGTVYGRDRDCGYYHGYYGRGYYWRDGRRFGYRRRYESCRQPKLQTDLIGVDVGYYFDNNMFFGLGVGSAYIGLTADDGAGYSRHGTGLQVRIGKQWRVMGAQLLGVALGFNYLKTGDQTVTHFRANGDRREVHYDDARATTVFVTLILMFD